MQDPTREFVVETREHLAVFEQSLLALERTPAANAVRELIDRGLRAIHSLKGDAGFLGFSSVRSVAHAMESLLENYRHTAAAPPTSVVEALLAARDRLAALVEDIESHPNADVTDVIARLERQSAADRAIEFSCDLSAKSRELGGRLAGFLNSLAELGSWDSARLDVPACDLRQAIPQGVVQFSGRLLPTAATEIVAKILRPAAVKTLTAPTSVPSVPSLPPVPSSTPRPTPAPSPESDRPTSLRVHVELLDRLMTLVGELTLVRNQSLLACGDEESALRTIMQRLNSVTSDLQDTVMRTRMQPVENLFGKFPRMVRDLARQLGKQVEVTTVGHEVELDKTVLEQLSDPLTHLIRNSMDHGIELPEVRVARGKPPAGQITLSATAADGQVLIEIRDDGKGIDPAAIKAKAAAMRLRTAAELDRMSPKELTSLILLPGFSTAQQVTDVSGRGVGMDVVRTNVEQLEGSLTIDSTPGSGTSMLLRVPLTLAIIPCLIVDVGDERYAVPRRELEEIVCLHPGGKGSIEQAFDGEVYRLRDRLLPIVRFRDVLERPQPFRIGEAGKVVDRPAINDIPIEYILVLRSGGKRFGLLVDRVRGIEEVVVKPMQTTMKRLGIFAGATIMGDGRVALIANVEGILQHSGCRGDESGGSAAAAVPRDPAEVHRTLIFEYGPQEQFAVPLIQIRRIEAISREQLERVGSSEFVTLGGVATRIVRLNQFMNVSPCEPLATMYLLIPKFVPEPMGILISRIIDTESLAFDLQRGTVSDPGILGSAIVRGRISLFLDLQFIREQLFGRTEPERSASQQVGASERRVLLIDDTPFFREVVKRYFEAAGMTVTTAVDGQDGLNQLAGGRFDLVVSDLEMPVLDGFGFATAARQRGCRLPILALTSLSKLQNEARARACGFDEFEEKLDHDRLVRAVNRLLDSSLSGVVAGVSP